MVMRSYLTSGDSFKDNSDLNEDIQTTNEPELSMLHGLGSGDERDLTKNINVSHIKHKCDNCSLEFAEEQQYNCDDYRCDYISFNESNMFEDNDSNNEWDCRENCSNVSAINTRDETEENSAILKPIQTDKNLTDGNFQRSFTSEVTYNIDSVANKSIRNKLETVDGSGQECLDCNHDDFGKVNQSATENVFYECDECNHEDSKKVNKSAIENDVFNECDECKHEDSKNVNKTTIENDVNEFNSTISSPSNISEYIFLTELIMDIDKILNIHEIDTSSNNTSTDDHVGKGILSSSISGPFNESEEIFPNELLIDTDKIVNIDTSSNTTSADDYADKESFNLETQFFISPNESTENTQRFLKPISLAGSGEGTLSIDSEESIDLEETTCIDFGEECTNKDTKSQNVHQHSTERNDQRLRPIFFTGSGDGGLFEDGGGVINFLEEEETTSTPQNISSRHERLDDQLNLFVTEEKYLNESKQSHFNSNESEQNSTVSVMPFRRRGRMNDTIELTDFENNLNFYNFNNKDGNLDKKVGTRSDIDEQITNESKIPSTVSSDAIHTNGSVLDNLDYLNKASQFQPIHCTAAGECNATLNERCITINSSKVCDCSRGYIRNKETRKCIAKCPQDYCNSNGHCEPLPNNERKCLCLGLYFGRRCEVSGLYVLMILGLICFICAIILLLVIFKKRCSRIRYKEFQDSDVNVELTEMKAISSPTPDIAVTQPTVTESV